MPVNAPSPQSAIAWLDYREEDAQRVRELLRSFEEKGTLDSIGIGTVRDTIADLLFPGLSTLHTRARYFFFIPWLYGALEADAERRPGLRARMPAAAREREVLLMSALEAGGEAGGGVIGIQRRERVRVLPRDIYWGGLRRLGFLLFQGPSRAYLERIARGSQPARRRAYSDDGDIVAGSPGHAWRPGIPPAPDGFLEAVDFGLKPSEAAYMVERVTESAPDSLFSNLLRLKPSAAEALAPWELPELGSIDAAPRVVLDHAELFSHAIFGAQVIYNELLVRALRGDGRALERDDGSDVVTDVRTAREEWLDVMERNEQRLRSWDRDSFWALVREANPRVPLQTRAFVDQWMRHALADPEKALDSPATHRLVRERERSLKGPLARLASQRAREVGEPPFGMEPLNYRWRGVGQQVIADVCAGLTVAAASA